MLMTVKKLMPNANRQVGREEGLKIRLRSGYACGLWVGLAVAVAACGGTDQGEGTGMSNIQGTLGGSQGGVQGGVEVGGASVVPSLGGAGGSEGGGAAGPAPVAGDMSTGQAGQGVGGQGDGSVAGAGGDAGLVNQGGENMAGQGQTAGNAPDLNMAGQDAGAQAGDGGGGQTSEVPMFVAGEPDITSCASMTAYWNHFNPDKPADPYCVESIDTEDGWDALATGYRMTPSGVQEVAYDEVKFFFPFKSRVSMANAFAHTGFARSADAGPIHNFFAQTFLRDWFVDMYTEFYFAASPDRTVNMGTLRKHAGEGGVPVWVWDVGGSANLSCEDQQDIHRLMLDLVALRPLFRAGWDKNTVFGSAPPQGCALPTWVPVND